MRTVFLQSNKDSRDRVDYEDEYARRGKVSYWTPVLTFATPGDLAVTYSIQSGEYSRSGNLIEASFRVVTTAFTWTTASGNLRITGLPFTASGLTNDANIIWHGACVWGGVTKAGYTQLVSQISSGANVIEFTACGSGSAASTVVAADVPSGGTPVLRATLTFRIR